MADGATGAGLIRCGQLSSRRVRTAAALGNQGRVHGRSPPPTKRVAMSAIGCPLRRAHARTANSASPPGQMNITAMSRTPSTRPATMCFTTILLRQQLGHSDIGGGRIGIRDQGAGIRDQGSGIRDRGSEPGSSLDCNRACAKSRTLRTRRLQPAAMNTTTSAGAIGLTDTNAGSVAC